MAMLRHRWAQSVSVAGARETAADSAIYQTFKSACQDLANGKHSCVSAAVESAMRTSEEWKKAHASAIRDMFASIHGREPSAQEVREVWGISDPEQLADTISDMVVPDTGESAAPSPDDVVDEDWIQAFEDAYGREPMVREYLQMRGADLDLDECASLHKTTCESMRSVYRRYFDEPLSEQDFIRKYLTRMLEKGGGVVEEVRDASLCDPKYKHAMLERLSHLYGMISGEDMDDAESAHVFEKEVKGKKLPLDTEDLNNIVADYVFRGEQLRAEVRRVFMLYLGREAQQDELDKWVPAARVDETQIGALKSQLSRCHEFYAVLADMIDAQSPGINRRERSRVLSGILEGNKGDLAKIEKPDDLIQIIAARSGIETDSAD